MFVSLPTGAGKSLSMLQARSQALCWGGAKYGSVDSSGNT